MFYYKVECIKNPEDIHFRPKVNIPDGVSYSSKLSADNLYMLIETLFELSLPEVDKQEWESFNEGVL